VWLYREFSKAVAEGRRKSKNKRAGMAIVSSLVSSGDVGNRDPESGQRAKTGSKVQTTFAPTTKSGFRR
jgi:hypothetical protein